LRGPKCIGLNVPNNAPISSLVNPDESSDGFKGGRILLPLNKLD
jgi:hypothetical protein